MYSLGATGWLKRLDGGTGAVAWEVNILAGNDNIAWGMSGSPLVYDDVVVVNPGKQRDAGELKAVVALDRRTGAVRWSSGGRKAGYSSPQLATLAGGPPGARPRRRGAGRVRRVDRQGTLESSWVTYQQINVAQPVVLDGDRVFVSAGYDHGGAMLRIARAGDRWSVEELWQTKSLRCKFTSRSSTTATCTAWTRGSWRASTSARDAQVEGGPLR